MNINESEQIKSQKISNFKLKSLILTRKLTKKDIQPLTRRNKIMKTQC